MCVCICMYAYACMHMYVCDACMRVHGRMHVCMHVHVRICMYVCMCVPIRMCIYASMLKPRRQQSKARCSPCLAACPQRLQRPQAARTPAARSHALILTAAQASGPPDSSDLPALAALRRSGAQPLCLLILSDRAARHVQLGRPDIQPDMSGCTPS